MKFRLLFISLSVIISMNLYSQIIVWSTTPEYDELKPYSEGIYYCKKDSKWGLLSDKGKVLIPPKYDYITSLVDGYAIAGVKDGVKNRISCIIDKSYNYIELDDIYYLVNKYYSYFSEEKLPVSNVYGKQGFINTNGELVVKCQFDYVHPFSNGFASVSKSPYAFYIKEKYDSSPRNNTLPIEFNNGEITFASSFYNETAVVAYNEKSAVINTKGQKIDNYKGKINSNCYNKYDYTIVDCGSKSRIIEYVSQINNSIISFKENDLYGYKIGTNTIVYPSFSTAYSFMTSGYAIASINGKFGLLHIIDGSISTYLAKQNSTTKIDGSLSASSKGEIEKYDYVVTAPSFINQSDLKFFLDNGNGHLQECTLTSKQGTLRTSFIPSGTKSKPKDVIIASEVYYKGILLYKHHQSFEIFYPVTPKIVVYGPFTKTERANKDDYQVICATVSNPTDNIVTGELRVFAKKNGSGSKLFTVKPGENDSIKLSLKIYKEEVVPATIKCSTGSKSIKQVTLKPFY